MSDTLVEIEDHIYQVQNSYDQETLQIKWWTILNGLFDKPMPNGYYFVDECQMDFRGPFATKELCNDALAAYVHYLETGE